MGIHRMLRTRVAIEAARSLGSAGTGLSIGGLAAFAVLAGCRAPHGGEAGSRLQRVVGSDERVELRNVAYPFGSVLLVQIMTGDAAGTWLPCTATLVSRDTIVTATHCVKSLRRRDGDKSRTSVVFRAADGAGGFRTETARVSSWVAVTKGADVAVGVLDKPWGDELGWMTVSFAEPAPPEIVSSIGFPSERFDPVAGVFPPSLQEACAILTYDPTGVRLPDGDIGYDCDTSGGSSGGALFHYDRSLGRALLHGVVTGGFRVDTADSYLEYPNYGYSGVTFAAMAARVSRIASAYRDIREVAPGYAALDRYLGVIDKDARLATRISDVVAMGERILDEGGKFPSAREFADALAPPAPSPTPAPSASPQPPLEPTPAATPIADPVASANVTPVASSEPTPDPVATEPSPVAVEAPRPAAIEAAPPTPTDIPASVATIEPTPEAESRGAPSPVAGPAREPQSEPQPEPRLDASMALGPVDTPTAATTGETSPEKVRTIETPVPSLDPTPEPDATPWP